MALSIPSVWQNQIIKNNFRPVVLFAGDNNWIYSKRNKYINIHKVILPSNKIMLMNFVCLCDHDVNISTHGLIQDGTQYVKQNIWLKFIQGGETQWFEIMILVSFCCVYEFHDLESLYAKTRSE